MSNPAPESTKPDASTEQRILDAARKVFTHKGYAATRVKDIAEEAGINIALLNYYFRSKERLFEIIMMENMQHFAGSIVPILANPLTTLDEKVQALAGYYIDMLTSNPNLPLFVLNVINTKPEKLAMLAGGRGVIMQLPIARQIREAGEMSGNHVDPLHLLVNLLAMMVFPFAARPLLQVVTGRNDAEFRDLMEERKRLIPIWFRSMISGR